MAEAINRQVINFDVLDQPKQYEEQYVHQIGDDDYHLGLYPEIDPPAASTAPETLADANCIYVSFSAGNDSTGDGSTATPYKTINKAITIFFAQSTRVKKYICLKDDYIYVENIQIPRWLEDNIFSNGSDDPRIRRIERTIPVGIAQHTGNVNLSGGYNFAAANKTIDINICGGGLKTITLNSNCANLVAIVNHINSKLLIQYSSPCYARAFISGNFVGIRTVASKSTDYITLDSGTALVVLGWTANTYNSTILDDTNTIWVDVNSAVGSDANSGTRLSPYLTINKALDANRNTDIKNCIAVKVDDTYYSSTENIIGYDNPYGMFIFPYMSSDGIEIKAGKSLELTYKSDDALKYTNALFRNDKYKQQYLISKNWSSAVMFYIVNKATDTYAIQFTEDFININTESSLSSKNWTGIGEYFYNGSWYLFICADDGGTNMRIFYRGTPDGEYQIATTGVASTTAGHYIISDGNNAFMICYTASGSYIYKCVNNADITSAGSWSLLYTGTGTIYMTLCDDGNFYFCESGVNKVFKYNKSTTSYDTYDLGAYSFLSIFYFNENLYGIYYDTLSTYNKIYKLDLTNLTATEICSVGDVSGTFKSIFIEHDAVYILINNTAIKDTIYNFDGNNIYIYQSNIYNASISTYQVLGQYQKTFNGQFILSATNAQGFGYINSGIISYFSAYNVSSIIPDRRYYIIYQGVKFNNNNLNYYIHNGIYSNMSCSQYCSFYNFNIGYKDTFYAAQKLINGYGDNYNLFINCNYPLIVNSLPSLTPEFKYNLFYNFKTAISYYTEYGGSNMSLYSNIGLLGDTFIKIIHDYNKGFGDSLQYIYLYYNIIDKISNYSNVLNSNDKSGHYTKFYIIDNLIYPYSTGLIDNDNSSGNIYTIPLYRDIDNYDFRLQNNHCLASNGEYYKYTSKGVALDTTNTSTPTGKDYNWVAYTAQSTDYGCFTVLTPKYKDETWESLTPTITPKDLSINKKQDKTQIQTTLDDITYKTTPLMKRAINISFSESPLLQDILLNTQKIDRLMTQTDPFKFMPNPLKTEYSKSNYEELTYASQVAWLASDMYGYIVAGKCGFESGSFAITDMVLNLNKTIEKGLYDKLFVIIYKEPSSYPGDLVKWEYRISNTTKAGLLTLEDYFNIGDITNGTYACVIAYALVLHDVNELQNKANVYAGLNYTDHSVMSGQTIQLIEV